MSSAWFEEYEGGEKRPIPGAFTTLMFLKYPEGNEKCVLFMGLELNFSPERESPLSSMQSQNITHKMKTCGHLISNPGSVGW